ncbi:MAG: hypothetical protein IH987_04345 [Planctomycetes bacterium]|nr:hypothetical protein [Planctomycetota bacterium]
MAGESKGRGELSGASLEELQARRAQAMRYAEEAAKGAAGARHQAGMYEREARKCEAQAYEVEAEIKRAEAKHDPEAVKRLRRRVVELRAGAAENYQNADSKARRATLSEHHAANPDSEVMRLVALIRRRGR